MSIQQNIISDLYKMADSAKTPEQIKSLQQHITSGIQDNTIPSYAGIPLLQSLTQQLTQPQHATPPQGPSIAQQVLQNAKQADSGQPPQMAPQMAPQGIDNAPSNLPQQMAQGGIVGFADGGDIEEEDDGLLSQIMAPVKSRIRSGYDYMSNLFSPNATPAIPNPATKPSGDIFQKALGFVLPHEGGFANVKNDLGGATNHGITKSTLEGYLGKKVSADDVKNLSPELAKTIYHDVFWKGIGADKMDPKSAIVAFDTAVNHGIGYAKNLINNAGADTDKMLQTRLQRYNDIVKNNPSQAKFLKGWTNRVNDLGNYTADMAEGGIVSLATGGEVKGFSGKNGNFVFEDPYGGAPYENNRTPSKIIGTKEALDNLKEFKKSEEELKKINSVKSGPLPPSLSSYLPKSSDEYTNFYPAALNGPGNASYLNQLIIESQKNPDYQPYKDEINKLLTKNPKLGDIVAQQNKQTNPYVTVPANLTRYFNTDMPPIDPKLMDNPPILTRGINSIAPDRSIENMTQDQKAALAAKQRADAGLPPFTPNISNPLNPDSPNNDGTKYNATPPGINTIKTDTSQPNTPQPNKFVGPPDVTPWESDVTPWEAPTQGIASIMKPQEEMPDYMKGLLSQQDALKKQKEEDKYMALLAAGLGMMGGTSPYALSNIGKGALAGVSTYSDAAKQRALEQSDINKNISQFTQNQAVQGHYKATEKLATDKLLQDAYQAKNELKYHYDSLGQNKEKERENYLLESKRIDAYIQSLENNAERKPTKEESLVNRAEVDISRNPQLSGYVKGMEKEREAGTLTPEKEQKYLSNIEAIRKGIYNTHGAPYSSSYFTLPPIELPPPPKKTGWFGSSDKKEIDIANPLLKKP